MEGVLRYVQAVNQMAYISFISSSSGNKRVSYHIVYLVRMISLEYTCIYSFSFAVDGNNVYVVVVCISIVSALSGASSISRHSVEDLCKRGPKRKNSKRNLVTKKIDIRALFGSSTRKKKRPFKVHVGEGEHETN